MTTPIELKTPIDEVVRVRVWFLGGSSMMIFCNKSTIKETCDNLAAGILRNGLPQKDPTTGQYNIESFEGWVNGRGSQRVCLFWFHQVVGFAVERDDADNEMYKIQLETARIQLELMKKAKKDADKDDGWQG